MSRDYPVKLRVIVSKKLRFQEDQIYTLSIFEKKKRYLSSRATLSMALLFHLQTLDAVIL